ncbi:MAG: dTDP-4-dehydrorhamnose reductase [Chitinispirillales bacterium]|jgi:dTDP-4-dehydrorhamnose reductase|nr:dTDP-4-dehydrorhamnose reductase [Chitinispirillales bacterium]
MAKKILIIGSNGQLGYDLVNQANLAGHFVIPTDYPLVDLLDKSSVEACVDEAAPDVIVNCAAFTAVDDCETMREEAFALNADACGVLASAAKKHSALLVHFSTDYVFDGLAEAPYTEDSRPNPQSAYGKSKRRGEEAIAEIYDNFMIFRIAWLYGTHGNNFVKTIRWMATSASRAKEKKPLKIVNDQFGTPTWTVSVCRQVLAMLGRPERGIFHCTSEGFCSWYDFARELVSAYGISADLEPCTTKEFPRPAPRPAYGVLENARLKSIDMNIMPDWRDAFKEFLEYRKD